MGQTSFIVTSNNVSSLVSPWLIGNGFRPSVKSRQTVECLAVCIDNVLSTSIFLFSQ